MTSAPQEPFARRLHQGLDFAGFEQGRGRTAALATDYEVSRETARKWLNGLALPELERMIELALRLGISFEWLATGRGTLRGAALTIREPNLSYADREEMQIVGLVRTLTPKKRKALLELLGA